MRHSLLRIVILMALALTTGCNLLMDLDTIAYELDADTGPPGDMSGIVSMDLDMVRGEMPAPDLGPDVSASDLSDSSDLTYLQDLSELPDLPDGDADAALPYGRPQLVIGRAVGGQIMLDGEMDAVYQGVAPLIFKDFKQVSDNTVEVRALWSTNRLYFWFDVTDATYEVRSGKDIWKCDALDVHFDPLLTRAERWDEDDLQVIVDASGASLFNRLTQSAIPGLEGYVAHAGTDQGFSVEISLPWTLLGVVPEEGMTFGLLLAASDCDGAGSVYFSWDKTVHNNFKRSSEWGTLKLID